MSRGESARLELDVDAGDDRAVVAVRGELEVVTADWFAGLLDSVVDDGCHEVIVDFGGVTFIDAAALRVLVRVALRLREAGGSLAAGPLSDRVRRLVDLTGVGDLVVSASTESERSRVSHEHRVVAEVRGDTELVAVGSNLRPGSTTTTATVDAALRLVTALAAKTVENADGVSVTLERHGHLMTVAASDDAVKEMDRHQYETGEGPCLAAKSEGRWFYVESLAEEPRWPNFVPLAYEQGIRSILSSPLLTKLHPQGALNMYSSTERAFGTSQQELAGLFAEQASEILTTAESDLDEHVNQRFAAALTARQVIHRAQGVLMERDHLSAEDAMRTLHRAARTAHVMVVDHATEVLASVGRADGQA